VKKSDVLKMVCELYECEPRMFKEQYDKVDYFRNLDLVFTLVSRCRLRKLKEKMLLTLNK
jgi:hypothetical protein